MQDSFLFGLSSGLLVLFALAAHNWKRSRYPKNLELQVNRLLTRYPLVFLSGKRSLFYFMSYWNEIPSYLASHGYEVFLKPLSWSNEDLRTSQLHDFLEHQSQQGKPLHLVIDSSSESQLESLLSKHNYPCLKSVTLIPPEDWSSQFRPRKNPLFWKIHLGLTKQNQNQSLLALGFQFSESLKNIYLDRCQFLAERDLIQGERSTTLIL